VSLETVVTRTRLSLSVYQSVCYTNWTPIISTIYSVHYKVKLRPTSLTLLTLTAVFY